jgi:hypothetical protein
MSNGKKKSTKKRLQEAETNLREIQRKIAPLTTPKPGEAKPPVERWTDSDEITRQGVLSRQEFINTLRKASRPTNF